MSDQVKKEKKMLADMRKELREARKESVKPVSRMRKSDIAAELEKLRHMTETTPLVAATPMAEAKKAKAAVEPIEKAKEMEFPTKPSKETVAVEAKAQKAVKKAEAKPPKKDLVQKLMKLLESE
jgi:hypothetical protein